MEKVVLVKSLYRNTSEYLSKEVTISGWIRTLRASNAFGFIEKAICRTAAWLPKTWPALAIR